MLSKTKNKYFRDGAEITPEEYAAAVTELKEKANWVGLICSGGATIEDVPASWREEIEECVKDRMKQAELSEDDELSAVDAMEILLGGSI